MHVQRLLRKRQVWRAPEWNPRKLHVVGVMRMNEGTNDERLDGRHVRSWSYPGRPGGDHRSVPGSHRSFRRVVRMAHAPGGQKPKLLDQVRDAIRTRHYSVRTEEAYVGWIKRFIFFHGKRHPLAMGQQEVAEFLSALAVKEHVSASTQNQALCALLFLYRHVLGQNLGWLDDVVRAKRP
jgi:Phage integrase, N-terminal SAM-like domain